MQVSKSTLVALLLTGALTAPAQADVSSLLERPSAMPAIGASAWRSEWSVMQVVREVERDRAGIPVSPAAPSWRLGEREAATALGIDAALGEPRFDVSLAIWHCIRAIRAQSENRPILSIGSRLDVVKTLTPQVSAVPLPGAAGLMLIGLLGLAGTRIRKRGASARDDAQPSPTMV